MPAPRILPALAALAPLASLAAAYSFNIVSTPRQCRNLAVDITGTGSPPYTLLIIPIGPTPLSNLKEVRLITNVPFNSSTSVSFQLKFPENSQFIAVVSDSTGFGTGGTSSVATVLSGDDGCFDENTEVSPDFIFHTDPDGVVPTCTTQRLWWNSTQVQGTAQFKGVIPGGESFAIPQGTITNVTNEGTGFNWTPNVRSGTMLVLVAGDDRGPGTGGSNAYTVQTGSSSSCLNGTSPSSTPGSPAGGSYPTSTDGSGTGSNTSGGSSVDVGAIVGGVVGGVVGAIAIGLILLFLMRRRRFHGSQKERPVDLLQDHEDGAPVGDNRLPEYYQPEPFVLPDPTVMSTHDSSYRDDPLSASGRPSGERRQSYLSTSTSDAAGGYLRAGTSLPSTSARKSPAPPSFRPVNIIQHDDAGPSDEPAEPEPETIELPPAYTNIKPRGPAAPSSVGADDGESTVGGASTVLGSSVAPPPHS